jgi:hypothetical protein
MSKLCLDSMLDANCSTNGSDLDYFAEDPYFETKRLVRLTLFGLIYTLTFAIGSIGKPDLKPNMLISI